MSSKIEILIGSKQTLQSTSPGCSGLWVPEITYIYSAVTHWVQRLVWSPPGPLLSRLRMETASWPIGTYLPT